MDVQTIRQRFDAASSSVQEFSSYVAQEATKAYQYTCEKWEQNLPILQETATKVANIAIPVINVGIGFLLFAAQSSMFVLGGLVSVLAPEFMQTSIDRIRLIWNDLSIGGKAVSLIGGTVAFPITTAIAAFFVGGHFTLNLLHEAYRAQEQEGREMHELYPEKTTH
jgi:hypothetical protein